MINFGKKIPFVCIEKPDRALDAVQRCDTLVPSVSEQFLCSGTPKKITTDRLEEE